MASLLDAANGPSTAQNGNIAVPVLQVPVAAYTCIDSYADVPGSHFDARQFSLLSITLLAVTQGATFQIVGANINDFTDRVVIGSPIVVAAASVGTYVTAQAQYAFYCLQAKNTSAGQVSTATANIFMKKA